MTKQVATTSIIGAVINILVNVLLIKYIGLYAASLSTCISYFVMMIYRHLDIKKYINIKFDNGLIIKSIIIYSFSIVLYYINNVYLNVLNLLIVILYSFLINKGFLIDFKNVIVKKFKHF